MGKINGNYESEDRGKVDLLLGDNLDGRKEYIATEGSKYTEMLDLS